LYGGINKGIDVLDFNKKIQSDSRYRFNSGTASDIKRCIERCSNEDRMTNNHCDCETALGAHNANRNDLLEFADFIYKLRNVKGAKYIFLSKNWWEHITKTEQTVHIDDIKLIQYLADIKEDCLYKIQLYKKYY
jgi:hypothetical protein